MALSRDSRSERKWKAYRRAEFRLKQTFERIDFEEDELGPEIELLKSGKAIAHLPAGAAFDFIDTQTKVQAQSHEPRNHSEPETKAIIQGGDETDTHS